MAEFVAFGRSRYDEPLRHVGDLGADADADAAAASELARERFADGLIELCLIPANDIVWVLRHEGAA